MFKNTRHYNKFQKTDENTKGTSVVFDAAQSWPSCQVEESKTCNPTQHGLQTARMTDGNTDLGIMGRTGQICVSAYGLHVFTLELTDHQSLGVRGRTKSSETALSWVHANITYTSI